MSGNVIIRGVDENGKDIRVKVTTDGSLSLAHVAGEEGADDSATSKLRTTGDYNITRCDIDQTETLVSAAPCRVYAVIGNDANTGYTDLIDANATGGGSTPKLRVNCGDGVNPQWLGGARFENGLCVDGESAGHDVTILWSPIQ